MKQINLLNIFRVILNVNLIVENVVQIKNRILIYVNVSVKSVNFVWIPSTCPCQCVKHCDINKYLKHWSCVKTIIDDLVITRDEIIDEPRTALINSHDKKAKHKINYYHTSILSKV